VEPHSSICQDVLRTTPPLPRLQTTGPRRAHRPQDETLSRSHSQRAMRRGDFLLSCRCFLTSPFCCTTEHLSPRPSPPRFVQCDADVSPAAPLSCFSGHEPLSKPLPIPLSLQVVKMQTTVEQQLQALAAIQRLLSLSPNPPDGRKDRDSELSGLV
jgi:hypothetical protein